MRAVNERGTDLNVNFKFLTKTQMAEEPYNMSESFGTKEMFVLKIDIM